MKQQSLIRHLMSRFSLFVVVLLVLSAPIFYFIVTNFYVEDLQKAVALSGMDFKDFDLEEDTVIGLVWQVLCMVCIFALALFAVMRWMQTKLWRPFYSTLHDLETFKVEEGNVPTFADTDIREFSELNSTLTRILQHAVGSYQVQKQFTENASHELQTPLAIVQGKLDLLMQDGDLTARQAELLQSIYGEINRMSRPNKNLLLLARLENAQYRTDDRVDITEKLNAMLPSLKLLAGDIDVEMECNGAHVVLDCNEVLFESLVSNLFVNAVRHNRAGGRICLRADATSLMVGNTSDETALDCTHLFERFHIGTNRKGNGLGLSIVKSICTYHGWKVRYEYEDGMHAFVVQFISPA